MKDAAARKGRQTEMNRERQRQRRRGIEIVRAEASSRGNLYTQISIWEGGRSGKSATEAKSKKKESRNFSVRLEMIIRE